MIINIIIKFMICYMIFNGILTCFKRMFNQFETGFDQCLTFENSTFQNPSKIP